MRDPARDFFLSTAEAKQPLLESRFYEAEFVRQVLVAAEDAGAEIADRPLVLFTGFEPEPVRRRACAPGTIAFIFDEQRQSWPEVVGSAAAVLQAYVDDADVLGSNHTAIPLGFARSFQERSHVRPSERELNVFFSGNLHRGRDDFHRWLSGWPLPFVLRARIQRAAGTTFDERYAPSWLRFSDGFGRGLAPSEYSDMLARSKIVLCPGGSCSVESYRFYEAIRAGCLVISEPLPRRASMTTCPAPIVTRWTEAGGLIERYLDDPVALDEAVFALGDWYAREASPVIVGQRLATLLRQAERRTAR